MSRKIFLLLISSLFLFACTENELDSAIDTHINSQTSFRVLDDFTVELETVLLDSIVTSTSSDQLVGKYTDSELGTVASTAYFEVSKPSDVDADKDEIYDSLILVLKYSDNIYGDTLQSQTIYVHRLLEEMDDDDDEGVLYNTTSFEYSSDPIGEETFVEDRYIERSNNELRIHMSDDLGKEFLTKMKNDDDSFDSDDDFRRYFWGMALKAGSQNTAILSFQNDSTSLILYSHYVGVEKQEYERKFAFNSSNFYFNGIDADRSSTLLKDLKEQKESVPASETDDKSYLQGSTGIVTRINFPDLKTIMDMDATGIMYKAILILRPYLNSDDEVPLPESFNFYKTDSYNKLISLLVDDDNNTVAATLYEDVIHPKNTYYAADLTSFISNEISSGSIADDIGLIVSLPSSELKGSFNRLVFDAGSSTYYEPELQLYYIFYE